MGREYLRPPAKARIMDAAVISGDFLLASGIRADKKFDFDRIADDSPELQLCVNGLVNCIEDNFKVYPMRDRKRHAFDAIATVAHGATRLGELVANELSLPALFASKKDPDGNFYFDENDDFGDNQNILLVDDVYTYGTNMEKVRRALPLGTQVVGGAVILNRSPVTDRPQLSNYAPVFSVLREVL